MSEEVLKSELDLFKKISFQKSIDHSQIIQYRPTSALTESSIIEFDIPISHDEYLDLQNVNLFIKGKIVQADGTNMQSVQDGRYSLINYGLNTIFDQLSVFIGSTLVSQSSNTYHYLSYIEALTQYTPTASKTIGRTSGYVSTFERPNYEYDTVDSQLSAIVKGSKNFTLYGRIHGAIFNSDKLLLNGLNLRLIFTRASPQFYCMGLGELASTTVGATTPIAEAPKPKLSLSEISIFARKVKVTSGVLIAHNKALQISKAIYPIKRSVVKVLNLPANQNTFVLDNIVIGQQPCKIIIGLVTNDAFSGSYRLNPFAFKNHNLCFLCVHLNGETFPKTPYEPDYSNNNYEREYYDFLLNLGASKSLIQPAIDYDHYKKGTCLYCFNFNSDFEQTEEFDYINIPKQGFLNIELKFKENLSNPLKLIFYAQFDNIIQIDENRNVIIDYSG